MAELVYAIYSNTGIQVEDIVLYRGVEANDTVNLSSLSKNGIVIIRLFGDNCSICSDFILQKVREEFPGFEDNDRVVFIVTGIPERLKNNYFGKKIYSLRDNGSLLSFDQYHIPYFFFLDDLMVSKLFFIPDLSYPQFVTMYFRILKERYFSSDLE